MERGGNILMIFIMVLLFNCSEKETTTPPKSNCVTENFFSNYTSRNFKMGFSTWSFGPKLQDVEDTYTFINNNSDIYSEHIDNSIPWNAWINNLDLPEAFTNEIKGRAARKIKNKQLVVSVSLLNQDRSELAQDYNGTIPNYNKLSDSKIEDAYFKHINYIVDQLNPNYLIIAIEVNELKLRSPDKWNDYTSLIKNVTSRVKTLHPNLKISESISLHNLYNPTISSPEDYINTIINHVNSKDFVAISFYPFLKDLHSKTDFQQAFNFLHNKITKPIAFVESSHISENLSIPSLNVAINSNNCEQNTYLETLITNAQLQDYEFIIWWTHRDYDALWETFPNDVKDIGKIWKDSGIIEETGNEKPAYKTWETIANISLKN